MELFSATAEYDSKLFTSVISAKVYENRPSSSTSLLPMRRNIPARTIVSLCLAGRLSIVSWAGSWPDLHTRVWGSVRLFCTLVSGQFIFSDVRHLKPGVASCVEHYPHEATMVLFAPQKTIQSNTIMISREGVSSFKHFTIR